MTHLAAQVEPRILRLTDREIATYLDIESITSITWYDGSPPIPFIQDRVGEILALNPWLAGRFVKVDGRVSIRYFSTPVAPEAPYFNVVRQAGEPGEPVLENGHDKPSPKEKLDRIFAPYCVKRATQSINKDEPIFRVTVVQRVPDRFAICVSLSHAIADGRTFYNFYRMLSFDQQPRALVSERDQAKIDEILRYTGEDEKLFRSVGFVLNLLGKIVFQKNGSLYSRRLERSWIAEQKGPIRRKAAENGSNGRDSVDEESGNSNDKKPAKRAAADIVLPNDILTSLFFRKTNCDVGLMAIDFRNRIPGLSPDHVGNYEAVLFYQRGDYETPQLIRASLVKGRYKRAVTGKILPTFANRFKATFAAITNVSGLFYPVSFEGCNELLHTFYWVPHKMPMHYGVIYKTNKNTTAFMTMEPGGPVNMRKLHEEGVVAEEIDTAQYC